MQVTPKKIELPTRKDKQSKSDIKTEIRSEKEKNQKKDDKESNLLFRDYLKFFMLIFLTVFTCFYCFSTSISHLLSLIASGRWQEIESFHKTEWVIFVLLLCITIKAWYALLKSKNVFKAFLEDFNGSEEAMDDLESEPREFTEKEKRQLRIFVNCTIVLISVLLIIDSLKSGIVIAILSILLRKKIAAILEEILKEENNGKDS